MNRLALAPSLLLLSTLIGCPATTTKNQDTADDTANDTATATISTVRFLSLQPTVLDFSLTNATGDSASSGLLDTLFGTAYADGPTGLVAASGADASGTVIGEVANIATLEAGKTYTFVADPTAATVVEDHVDDIPAGVARSRFVNVAPQTLTMKLETSADDGGTWTEISSGTLAYGESVEIDADFTYLAFLTLTYDMGNGNTFTVVWNYSAIIQTGADKLNDVYAYYGGDCSVSGDSTCAPQLFAFASDCTIFQGNGNVSSVWSVEMVSKDWNY